MTPHPEKTLKLDDHHFIEIGPSSWNPSEISIRNRYESPETGKFKPHASSEISLGDLVHMMKHAARHDILEIRQCSEIIEALVESIARRKLVDVK